MVNHKMDNKDRSHNLDNHNPDNKDRNQPKLDNQPPLDNQPQLDNPLLTLAKQLDKTALKPDNKPVKPDNKLDNKQLVLANKLVPLDNKLVNKLVPLVLQPAPKPPLWVVSAVGSAILLLLLPLPLPLTLKPTLNPRPHRPRLHHRPARSPNHPVARPALRRPPWK